MANNLSSPLADNRSKTSRVRGSKQINQSFSRLSPKHRCFLEDSCINNIAIMEWGLLLLMLGDVVVQAWRLGSIEEVSCVIHKLVLHLHLQVFQPKAYILVPALSIGTGLRRIGSPGCLAKIRQNKLENPDWKPLLPFVTWVEDLEDLEDLGAWCTDVHRNFWNPDCALNMQSTLKDGAGTSEFLGRGSVLCSSKRTKHRWLHGNCRCVRVSLVPSYTLVVKYARHHPFIINNQQVGKGHLWPGPLPPAARLPIAHTSPCQGSLWKPVQASVPSCLCLLCGEPSVSIMEKYGIEKQLSST